MRGRRELGGLLPAALAGNTPAGEGEGSSALQGGMAVGAV